MSAEALYLHNPELASLLDKYVAAMDSAGRTDAPVVLFRPRFKEAKRRGIAAWRGHPLIEGPPTRTRARKPAEAMLL